MTCDVTFREIVVTEEFETVWIGMGDRWAASLDNDFGFPSDVSFAK